MKVTRENEKILITMNSPEEAIRLVKMLDYAKYIELTEGMNEVAELEIEKLADEVNQSWYQQRSSLL